MSLSPKTPRVWVISEVYWPEETSTGYFLTRIAEHLAHDYAVYVLCGQPKYDRKGRLEPPRQRQNGVEILRASGTTLDKNILLFRLLNVASITLATFVIAVRSFRVGDAVLITTNPPLLPYVMVLAARLRGARSILVIHDLYPDLLVAAGLVSRHGLLVRALDAVNRWLYGAVDRICPCGRDMAALVRNRVESDRVTDPIVVIPNWADSDDITPSKRSENALLHELGLLDRFVVQYAGNAGPIHSVETIIAAARLLASTNPNVHFLFLGSGAKWGWLAETVKAENLTNVSILGPLPRNQQQVFLNACDVTVSAFVPGMSGVGVPSRMYNIMAAGRPMIAAVDDNSEQAMVIREERIGWVVIPNDAFGLAKAVREAEADNKNLSAMSARARAAAESKYERRIVLEKYGDLLQGLGI